MSIVCHKGEEALRREMQRRKVHGADDIIVLYLEPTLVRDLADQLEKRLQLAHRAQ